MCAYSGIDAETYANVYIYIIEFKKPSSLKEKVHVAKEVNKCTSTYDDMKNTCVSVTTSRIVSNRIIMRINM